MRTGRFGELVPVKGFSRDKRHELPNATAWRSHDGVLVVSECPEMQLPGAPEGVNGPTWLVSVSRAPLRSTPDDVRRVVECFDMPAFDEDNHCPGVARALFCPVDEQWRNQCECKVTEVQVEDNSDYVWSNAIDEPCRGCEVSALKRATGVWAQCPLHPVAADGAAAGDLVRRALTMQRLGR